MNVLIEGVRAGDRELLEDVTQDDIDHWTAMKAVVHGDVIRPFATIARIQTNYEPPEQTG